MAGLEMKYFVLNPTKNDPYGEASRDAMRKYADSIREVNEDLARNLDAWVISIEDEFDEVSAIPICPVPEFPAVHKTCLHVWQEQSTIPACKLCGKIKEEI